MPEIYIIYKAFWLGVLFGLLIINILTQVKPKTGFGCGQHLNSTPNQEIIYLLKFTLT